MGPSTHTISRPDHGLWRNPRLRGRVSEIDGLRGLAIFFVIIWHYVACLITPAEGSLLYYLMLPLKIAWSGVDLFFVLSGFLIGGILIDAKDSESYFKTFYMRRFFRIFPLYYVWLAIFCVVLALPGIPAYLYKVFNTEIPIWAYPLYLQNFFMTVRQTFGAEWLGITWSLAIEEQFYLILPVTVRFLNIRTLTGAIIATILAAPVLRLILYFSGDTYFGPYTLLPCRADALGCGVLCAILVRHQEAWDWLKAHRSLLYAAMAVLSVGVIFLWAHSHGRIMTAAGYTWLGLFYSSWLLAAVVHPDAIVRGILNARFLQFMGIHAYGLYMFHQGVNALMHAGFFGASPVIHNIPTLAVTALAAVATFLLAKLSWAYFEKPLVKRGQTLYGY